jgi:hypothetical protein
MTVRKNKLAGEVPILRRVLGDVYWRPNRDTLLALVSYPLVVGGLFTAFQVFTTNRVATNFITFGPVTLAGLAVILPALYTVLVLRHPLAELGLTAHQLVPSLVLGLFPGGIS